MRRTIAGALLASLFTLPAFGQGVPERVEIGEGIMTVGYELKTTTHGNGPEGRTESHGLMKYIQPKASASWTAAEQAMVDRWTDMSIKERTGFFFKAYKGGHDSNNFEVDTVRYPFLDKSVSWYGSMNIPHIEVRSNPYENPAEALKNMKALKADVKETIAFHMHLRFPDTVKGAKGAQLTEWLRRTSWAVALKRADYSSKTDFVLKSMDNQPINVDELEKARKAFTAESRSAQNDIIERRGIRVSRLGNGADGKIDIEFRGLMRDTGRMESYLKATAETFGNGTSNQLPAYDAKHPIANSQSKGVIKFRTFGWVGKSAWEANELEWLADEVDRSRAEYRVDTRIDPTALREAVKRLATADTEGGKKMLLPSSFNWLFLALEYDPALPERVQEQVLKNKKTYIRKLVRLAERVHGGEFGSPGAEGYKPMAVASRTRRILYDFMNEVYKDGGRSAKLFEWFETSVFKPEEIKERNERYRQETGKNRAAEWEAKLAEGAQGEGFGRRRMAKSPYASTTALFPAEMLNAELQAVRRGMVARLTERIAGEKNATQRVELERGLTRVNAARFEIVRSADIFADAKGNKVRISAGLLNQLVTQTDGLPGEVRSTVLKQAVGLIAGHEIAHVAGIKGEKVADSEGVRAYERARGPITQTAVRAAMRAFTRPVGHSHWTNTINRLKSWVRYGTESSRIRNIQTTGAEDPLREFRRADGTLDWKRLGGSRALAEVGGLAHFGLALFLKELAVVAQTGDRSRIEEFFDGLLTTDFYKHYGLFVAGARVAEVSYVKYLQRYVRPGFVNGVLKTNLVLAAGLALPQIAEGNFNGKAFAISLGSLGLSSAAVKTGVAGIKWVVNLRKAKSTGTLARLGLRSTRFMKVGGWLYTAAELAVVLYLADEVGQFVNEKLDEAAAKNRIREAGQEFFKDLGDPKLTPEQVQDATDKYHAAWIDYRNYLYRPMHIEEALFAERLEKVARDAKLAEDRRAAAAAKLKKYPSLARRIIKKHGSLEKYAQSMVAADQAELDRKVQMYGDSYVKNRERLLKDVYDANRREGTLFGNLEDRDWLLLGGRQGAQGDPWNTRSDRFAGWGRDRAQAGLGRALERVSPNRLQAYQDERAVLEAAARAAEAAGLKGRAEILRETAATVEKTRAMDDELIHGKDGLINTAPSAGLRQAMEKIRRGGE
jgi:hypothetical protein